jgi:tetratricopeptide (TPR) repeat protein
MRTLPLRLIFLSSWLAMLTACSQNPFVWWKSVNEKAKELNHLEANYQALQSEHEQLKRDYYRLEDEYLELKAKVDSTEAGDRNLKATGTLTGRALSSIAYQVPKGLKPEEQLTLAYEHFTEKRFAEAAATFEDFFARPESAALTDAAAMYTAGVAWFQLGNFHKAREHFEEAKNNASGEQREKIHKKVDLWLRAIDRRSKGDGGTLGG